MRTTYGKARAKGKRRLFKKVKGYSFGKNRLTRTAKEALLRAGNYAFRDRKAKKREYRRLWIIRVNAACVERGLRYSQFIFGLHKAGITLDRKSLSEIAIADPALFDQIVAKVKSAIGL